MERLYRPGAEMVMTEPPAGAIEPGEKPEEAAERELREETGYEAESMEFLCKIAPNAATASNYAWCYLARNARPAGKQRLDETEALEVFEMTREQVLEGLRAGEFIQEMCIRDRNTGVEGRLRADSCLLYTSEFEFGFKLVPFVKGKK